MDGVRAGRVTIPADEIALRFSRSSGPGGQNVNRRDTRVEVVFEPLRSRALSAEMKRRAQQRLAARLDAHGRLRVTASAERTQAGNRRAALARLGAIMEEALRPPPPPRRATKPTRSAREKRLEQKNKRGTTKRLRRAPGDDE
jgi:ribosome-associated protein